jgi:putative AlgH/UPF0301 family transcriptional regulator
MFTFNDKFTGYLLASSPMIYDNTDSQKLILIISHSQQLVIGLQINQEILGQTIQGVGHRMGIPIEGEDVIWNGGTLGKDKIHVIHSADWMGVTSVKLSSDIVVTSDISVLTALSRSEGPSRFRACAGFYSWTHTELMDSLGIQPTGIQRKQTDWDVVPANETLVLESGSGDDQWLTALEASAVYQSSHWF